METNRTIEDTGRPKEGCGEGSASAKIAALEDAGIAVSPTPTEMADTLLKIYRG